MINNRSPTRQPPPTLSNPRNHSTVSPENSQSYPLSPAGATLKPKRSLLP